MSLQRVQGILKIRDNSLPVTSPAVMYVVSRGSHVRRILGDDVGRFLSQSRTSLLVVGTFVASQETMFVVSRVDHVRCFSR